MSSVIVTILSFAVLIGILVFIHELGHFLAARLTGMRADVFAVGMGPRLFGWNRITGFTFGKLPEGLELNGRTDYRISAFPLGGYVKIVGMVDESMDAEFASRPPQPWEFRSKNTLQKAFVISAGVIMNFLLAIGLMAVLNTTEGREVTASTTIGTVPTTSPAYTAGLRPGDHVLRVNGEEVDTYEELAGMVYVEEIGKDVQLDIDRAGTPVSIVIPRTSIPTDPKLVDGFFTIRTDLILTPQAGSAAEKGGLKPKDVLVSLDGKKFASAEEFMKYVISKKGTPIKVDVLRNGQPATAMVTPGSNGKMGVELKVGPTRRIEYSFPEALVAGFEQTVNYIKLNFNLIGALFSGKAKLKDSVGGPLMIAGAAGEAAQRGLPEFLQLMAYLSVTLGAMNILPIPALDGGHLVFIIIEAIMRREVPIKIRMAVQQVGVVLLMLLMAFVLYNDFAKF